MYFQAEGTPHASSESEKQQGGGMARGQKGEKIGLRRGKKRLR